MRSHEKRANVCPQTQGKYLVSVVSAVVFALASLFGTLLFSVDTVAVGRRISGGRASGQRNLHERAGSDWPYVDEERDGHIAG